MSGRERLAGGLGTLLALAAGYLIWRGSDLVVELSPWPDLLPVARLCAIVLAISGLEFLVQGLRRLLVRREAQAPNVGESG